MLRLTWYSSRLGAGVAMLASITAAIPVAAQDRRLAADFPEVYRVGGLSAPEWAQFTDPDRMGFDGAGNLYVLDRGA